MKKRAAILCALFTIIAIVTLAIYIDVSDKKVCCIDYSKDIRIRQIAEENNAVLVCKLYCGQKLKENTSLSSGPCLSEKIASGWVCDVAHNPRQAVDDLPENQCSAFRNGTAHHFVEVDENCGLIKAV